MSFWERRLVRSVFCSPTHECQEKPTIKYSFLPLGKKLNQTFMSVVRYLQADSLTAIHRHFFSKKLAGISNIWSKLHSASERVWQNYWIVAIFVVHKGVGVGNVHFFLRWTLFVFDFGPLLPRSVTYFAFNGKMARNRFSAIKSARNALQPSS